MLATIGDDAIIERVLDRHRTEYSKELVDIVIGLNARRESGTVNLSGTELPVPVIRSDPVGGKAMTLNARVGAATGQVLAPLPEGLIFDHLYAPMQLVLRRYGVGSEPRAVAHDARHFAPRDAYRHKARRLAGVLQLCAWLPAVLVTGTFYRQAAVVKAAINALRGEWDVWQH